MQDIVCHFVPVPSLVQLVRLHSSKGSFFKHWLLCGLGGVVITKSRQICSNNFAKYRWQTMLIFFPLWLNFPHKTEKKLSKWAAKTNFALDLPCRAIIGPISFYDFAWNVDSWGSQMTLYHPWLSEAAIRRSKFSGFFQWLFWVPMMVNKASMVKFWMCSAKNPSTGCQPVWFST